MFIFSVVVHCVDFLKDLWIRAGCKSGRVWFQIGHGQTVFHLTPLEQICYFKSKNKNWSWSKTPPSPQIPYMAYGKGQNLKIWILFLPWSKWICRNLMWSTFFFVFILQLIVLFSNTESVSDAVAAMFMQLSSKTLSFFPNSKCVPLFCCWSECTLECVFPKKLPPQKKKKKKYWQIRYYITKRFHQSSVAWVSNCHNFYQKFLAKNRNNFND